MTERFTTFEFIDGKTTIYCLEYSDFELSDYHHALSADELERLFSFRHVKRQREFVATRVLKHSIFGFQHIHYNAVGAPFIPGTGFLSISHCSHTVAIAVNKEFAIGLDLELPRAHIGSVMHKFLSEAELNAFDCADSNVVSKIWSAKEALYKLAGRKEILFSQDLLVEPVTENKWLGTIRNRNHDLHVKLNIFEERGIIFTINSEPVERIEHAS